MKFPTKRIFQIVNILKLLEWHRFVAYLSNNSRTFGFRSPPWEMALWGWWHQGFSTNKQGCVWRQHLRGQGQGQCFSRPRPVPFKVQANFVTRDPHRISGIQCLWLAQQTLWHKLIQRISDALTQCPLLPSYKWLLHVRKAKSHSSLNSLQDKVA